MPLFQEHVANKDIALRGEGGETKRFNICSCFLGLSQHRFVYVNCMNLHAGAQPPRAPAPPPRLLVLPSVSSCFPFIVCASRVPPPSFPLIHICAFPFFPSPSACGLLIPACSEACRAVWGWLSCCSGSAAEPEGCPERCGWWGCAWAPAPGLRGSWLYPACWLSSTGLLLPPAFQCFFLDSVFSSETSWFSQSDVVAVFPCARFFFLVEGGVKCGVTTEHPWPSSPSPCP